jgi:crotonobetainyl-CoA:carnitine CoA-transferase CaiB-like acyl-CoA transferase
MVSAEAQENGVNRSGEILKGLRVVDLSVGLAPALAVQLLASAGAEVTRMEPPAGDPFYDVYPAYRFWQRDKKILPWSPERLTTLLADAELCVLGGEDFPGLTWRHDGAEFRARHGRLTVLVFQAQPTGARKTPAVDLLFQARSGLSHEHFTDRPLPLAFPGPSYASAMSGLTAALAAVYSQRNGGPGMQVSTSLLQGALLWGASLWVDVNGEPARSEWLPKDPAGELLYRCSDGMFIQLSMGVPGALARLHRALGITSDASESDRGMASFGSEKENYYTQFIELRPNFAALPGTELLPKLWQVGVAAERVIEPGGSWDDAQTQINGIILRTEDGTRGVGTPLAFRTPSASPTPRDAIPQPPVRRRLPLEGVRIIDCGRFVAGPFSSVILGDLGADVIKLEEISGEPMRAMLIGFTPVNRGKRSIAVDAKNPQGVQIVRRLCASADVVHHNFRPGASARLGIDQASLHAVNPNIIVLETSAYGVRGPKAALPGFDNLFQAFSGLEWRGGKPDSPQVHRLSVVDFGTAMLGGVGMMMALVARAGGRGGSTVETCLLNGSLFMLSELIQNPDGKYTGISPLDQEQLGFHPAERFYRAADGWIAIAARGEDMAARLLRTLGIDASSPRSAWNNSQASAIARVLASRTVADILLQFAAADIWCEYCEPDGWTAAKSDGPLKACGAIIEGSIGARGIARQIGRAFDIEGVAPPAAERARVDVCGGNSRDILREQRVSDEDIEQLLGAGIVRAPESQIKA